MVTDHQIKTLIGLVGTQASGKDTVAEILVDRYDFDHISVSDILRQRFSAEFGREADRDDLRVFGNDLRAKMGPGCLVELALKEMSSSSRLAISGLRTVGEVEVVKSNQGSVLACDAPIELRYQRARERARHGDSVSLEDFKRQEEAEMFNLDPEAQNLFKVLQLADLSIVNDRDLEHLYRSIDLAVTSILSN